jgi:hypothetical protein
MLTTGRGSAPWETNDPPASRSEGRGVRERVASRYFFTAKTLVSTESLPRKMITL